MDIIKKRKQAFEYEFGQICCFDFEKYLNGFYINHKTGEVNAMMKGEFYTKDSAVDEAEITISYCPFCGSEIKLIEIE